MTHDDIELVFGRGRVKMVTGRHVEVFREQAAPGERRRYTKRFLCTDDGDFRHWTGREWRILSRLFGHGVGVVPEVVRFDRGAPGRPALVQTYDAGVTVDHWAMRLPVRRDRRLLRSVFDDCTHWWALAKHCLIALDAIHELGLVHLDLKPDNICIPVGPADFDPTIGGQVLRPLFEQIALIDFAFALVAGENLASALPMGRHDDYEYQSPRLLDALDAGRRGDLLPTRQLDWRCDIYSLAAILRRYLRPPDSGAADGWTPRRHAAAQALIDRLVDVHDRAASAQRPHRDLIEIASTVLRVADHAAPLELGWCLADDGLDRSPATATPVTRIVSPIHASVLRRRERPGALVVGPTPASPPREVADMVAAAPAYRAERVRRVPRATGAVVTAVACATLLAPMWVALDDIGPGGASRDRVLAQSLPMPERDDGTGGAAATDAAPIAPSLPAESNAAPAAPEQPAAIAVQTPAQTPTASAAETAGARRAPAPARPSVAPPAVARTPSAKAMPERKSATAPKNTATQKAAMTSKPVPPSEVKVTAVAAATTGPAPRAAARSSTPAVTAAPPPRAAAPSSPPAGVVAAAPVPSAGDSSAQAPGPVTTVAAPPQQPASAAAPMPAPPVPRPAPDPAPAPEPPVAIATLPRQFRARAEAVIADQLPRITQRAERLVLRVLHAAARMDHPLEDAELLDAARALRLSPDDALVGIEFDAADARRLSDAAGEAFWNGRNAQHALELQLRAFGANPLDIDAAGNLAFYYLKQRPAQPDAARRLALWALVLHDARFPTGRIEDWTTLAIASALVGRERDARNAFFVTLALAPAVDRLCRAANAAVVSHGEPLRNATEAMFARIRAWGRAQESSFCRWPAGWSVVERRFDGPPQ